MINNFMLLFVMDLVLDNDCSMPIINVFFHGSDFAFRILVISPL
jgi:hypothetical protein